MEETDMHNSTPKENMESVCICFSLIPVHRYIKMIVQKQWNKLSFGAKKVDSTRCLPTTQWKIPVTHHLH